MSDKVEFNQILVDKYFSNWIGISANNAANREIRPSCFGLYFPNHRLASVAYAFLNEWKNWMPNNKLILSIVKEDEYKYSFYFYKENIKEFVKGTFKENLIISDLTTFIKNEQNGKFVLLARYPNSNNDIIDNPSQFFITMDGLKFNERKGIKINDIENN
jgi:hypothetical protein